VLACIVGWNIRLVGAAPWCFAPGVLVFMVSSMPAQELPERLAPIVVQTTRAPIGGASPSSEWVFTTDDLRTSPHITLDDVLRESPAFSLFRRSGSLTANPTAQGVSLRGLGPSGASRSLVLRDGVPLNDPFGGWVAWSKVPAATLQSARIMPGGAANTWGNGALGGTIQLLTRPVVGDSTEFTTEAGDSQTAKGVLLADRVTHLGGIRVAAEKFTTGGFPIVGAAQRGSIDRNANSQHEVAEVDWRTAVGSDAAFTLTGRGFTEERGNGTPLQANRSREVFASATLSSLSSAEEEWSGLVYAQKGSFQSFFTSIAAGRGAETPVSNQYDVPATAAGAAVTAAWGGSSHPTTAGLDARWVRGESREAFLYSGATHGFTRGRFAGGEQTLTGVFVHQELSLSPNWRVSGGLRGDYWLNAKGHRQEIESVSRAILRNDHYSARDGLHWSPGLGVQGTLAPWLRVRGVWAQGFRLPTLNENYRPFRVGAITTDANPDLGLETNTGVEAGVVMTSDSASLSVTAFSDRLQGAVTNLTTEVNQRQRRNLPLAMVRGIEASATYQLGTVLVRVSYLGVDAAVKDAALASANLTGKRLPQVPRSTVTTSLRWKASEWDVDAQLRGSSEQFEDDENTLRLAPGWTAGLRVQRRLARSLTLFVAVENLDNARIETGRSADGLVNIGPPRLFYGGVHWSH